MGQARTRDRTRARRQRARSGPVSESAVQAVPAAVSETATLQDGRMSLDEEFLPEFLNLSLENGAIPVLALQLAHTGDGWVVEEAGGAAGDAAGAAGRTTTSNGQANQVTVASYTVSQGTTGRLEEVAAAGDNNMGIEFAIGSTTFSVLDAENGPSMAFDGLSLAEGTTVEVRGFSQDGTSGELNGLITAREI